MDSVPRRSNQLPPIQTSLSGRDGEGEEVILPPIRGTGLPPILPLSSTSTAGVALDPVSHRLDMFRVD